MHSHSQEEERVVDDKNRKKKTSYSHGECEWSHRERTASSPYRRSKKEKQDQERHKGPVTQRPIGLCKPVLELTRPTSADVAAPLVGPTNWLEVDKRKVKGYSTPMRWSQRKLKPRNWHFQTDRYMAVATDFFFFLNVWNDVVSLGFEKKKKRHQTLSFCARSRLLYIFSFPLLSP